MVLFRAPTMQGAGGIFAGMLGANGIGFPVSIYDHVGPLRGLLEATGGGPETWWGAVDFIGLTAYLLALLGIALLAPNTGQILARYEPALGLKTGGQTRLSWTPSLKWALAVAIVAFAAILRLGGPSEFLYWQF